MQVVPLQHVAARTLDPSEEVKTTAKVMKSAAEIIMAAKKSFLLASRFVVLKHLILQMFALSLRL